MTDPLLGRLADNGGPTWTHALLDGSPAIDGGSCGWGVKDQRGLPCPIDLPSVPNVEDGCDIGAFEALPPGVQVTGDLQDIISSLTGSGYEVDDPLED